MPLYHLRCQNTTCMERFDFFALRMRDRDAVKCPACGAGDASTDWERTGPPTIQRQFHDKEQIDYSLSVLPSQVAEMRKIAPYVPIGDDGLARFENDAQHRNCLKRLNADCDLADEREAETKAKSSVSAADVPSVTVA